MRFTKAHSLGNDFLIVEPKERGGIPDIPGFARRVCNRHIGVGADGLILATIEDKAKALAGFRIFNADGSESEISGNGLRCAAAYFFAGKEISGPKILFRTSTGDRECDLIEIEGQPPRIRVEMGRPRFASEDIPFDDGARHERIVDYPLFIHGKTHPVTLVSMGNPHCAIFFENFPDRIERLVIGREVEIHPFFPNRTNVSFFRQVDRHTIEVLFWERGAGETLSSGTGSTGAAAAAIYLGLAETPVRVLTPAGPLDIRFEGGAAFLTGPAEITAGGEYYFVTAP